MKVVYKHTETYIDLTIDKVYNVIDVHKYKHCYSNKKYSYITESKSDYLILNDKGNIQYYRDNRFELLEDIREEKLNNILTQ